MTTRRSDLADSEALVEHLQATSQMIDGLANGGNSSERAGNGCEVANTNSTTGSEDDLTQRLPNEENSPGGNVARLRDPNKAVGYSFFSALNNPLSYSLSNWALNWLLGSSDQQQYFIWKSSGAPASTPAILSPTFRMDAEQNESLDEITNHRGSIQRHLNDQAPSAHKNEDEVQERPVQGSEASKSPNVSQDSEILGIQSIPEEPAQGQNTDFFDIVHIPEIGSSESQSFGGSAIESRKVFFFEDKFQFIDGIWSRNRLISMNLCQLKLNKEDSTVVIVKQDSYFHVLIGDGDFVARAVARCDEFEKLDFTLQADRVKSEFFKLFCIEEILQNRLLSERDILLEQFVIILKEAASPLADSVDFATILILLSKLSKQTSSQVILSRIQKSKVQSNLRDAATRLLACNNNVHSHSDVFQCAQVVQCKPLNLQNIIREVFTESVGDHRASLMDKCPTSLPIMKSVLTALSPEKILYVTRGDIEVFDHLCSLTTHQTFLQFFEHVFNKFINKVKSVQSYTKPSDLIPLVSPVFGFLFKSFHETVMEICSLAENCSPKDMLQLQNGKWELKKDIRWPRQRSGSKYASRHDQTLFFKSLESQYQFILRSLKMFLPGEQSTKKRFSYDLKVLGSSKISGSLKSNVKNLFKNLTSILGLSKLLKDLPDERLVWLYLVDVTVGKVFSGRSEDCLTLYNPLLQGIVAFVAQFPDDNYESFRVVSHSALKFITQTTLYCSGDDVSKIDMNILRHQIAFVIQAAADMARDPLAFPAFRDLIDEFSRYWALRQLLIFEELVCPEILLSQIMKIFNSFMNIVLGSLTKDVPVSAIVGFFQFLNDFMDDFKDLDFLANWYVKEVTIADPSIVKKISNKLESTDSCSYQVLDLQKFVDKFDRDSMPTHYLICIVDSLLKLIYVCLTHHPFTNSSPVDSEQLLRTGLIMEAMRRSFLYLKEQPDYVDFDVFFRESVLPFERIISNWPSLVELYKRLEILKESFWYIRKMDEISIDQALELLMKENCRPVASTSELRECYKLYLEKYNHYIREASSKSGEGKALSYVIDQLHNELCDKVVSFEKWDKVFKTKKIPVILAILSSAWSLKMSKDVSVTEKFLKPHCVQILCALMLLSVNRGDEGVHNHLAQVSTGQGKSIILGLLAATLALTGHQVRVLCYSKYLSSRDKNDFFEFYNAFNVAEKIRYGTFEDMANELLNPEIDGTQKSLRDMVVERVKDHGSWPTLGRIASTTDNTVLLIDEVDVFFSKNFYGTVFSSAETMSLPGIAEIQEIIWDTVKTRAKQNPFELLSCLQNFIHSEAESGNTLFKELDTFRRTPGTFPLIIDDMEENMAIKQYTNLSWTDEHLMKMINISVDVANGSEMDTFISKYKLDEQGRVCCRQDDDTYSPFWIWSYYNVFNYFRLKKVNFDHKGHQNYGYLLLDTGDISYARLPDKFPLILGVSGTVCHLYKHERETVQKRYHILTHSVLPSFFGESNLVFNPLTDFTLEDNERDWCSKIFTRLSAMIDAQRAVLIFFHSESDLNQFKQENSLKFNRLSVYCRLSELTENTEVPDLEMGSQKERSGTKFQVTLATRMMGRGVDYKSSVAVEKNGGVHVIQTFCSIDIKEETQIRGRTARKGNKGSYELILCREHLKREGILSLGDSTQHTYDSLNCRRNEMMDQEGMDLEEAIKSAEFNHNITMEYFGL